MVRVMIDTGSEKGAIIISGGKHGNYTYTNSIVLVDPKTNRILDKYRHLFVNVPMRYITKLAGADNNKLLLLYGSIISKIFIVRRDEGKYVSDLYSIIVTGKKRLFIGYIGQIVSYSIGHVIGLYNRNIGISISGKTNTNPEPINSFLDFIEGVLSVYSII